ncbi:MAG TPA: outer membrane lipoprotein carrier protein LolA [bacterium]|nr:outer membrane lipoprotein carrier protein LolA [bacterium]
MSYPRTILAFLIVLLGVLPVAELSAQSDDLFLNFEALKSFKADFTQVFTAKLTKKKSDPEIGVIYYKAPSFMRFDYLKGQGLDRQTFISDEGVSFINYEKKTVMTKKGQGDYGDYLVFLKGVAEIKKKFSVKKGDVALSRKAGIAVDEGQSLFKLTPLKKIQNLRYLFLVLQGKEVRSVAVIDEIGNINQLFFKSVQYDPKMESSVFTFTAPIGFEQSQL